MDREEIKGILPHREPMLLLDSAYADSEGVARGKCFVQGNEWFLQGHFPDNPVVPGVILCEMVGQTACVLFAQELKGKTPFFTGMNNVKFKRVVKAGDTVEMECEKVGQVGNFRFIKGCAKVNGELCMKGEFSFFAE